MGPKREGRLRNLIGEVVCDQRVWVFTSQVHVRQKVLSSLRTVFIAAVAVITLFPWPTLAQQRPLATEDPESIGSGLVMIEGGFDYMRDKLYPVSGLKGHRFRVPTAGVTVGVSSIAEIQIDGISYQSLNVTTRVEAPLSRLLQFSGDTTYDMDDIVVGAKARVLSEGRRRPAVALRFATRLPNAGNESGLGLDTTDFINTVLVGKTFGAVRVVGNVGMGILGDPTRGDRQNDVVVYGVSLTRVITNAVQFVTEVNGYENTRRGSPPPGTDSSSYFRAGARYSRGSIHFDAALVSGLTARDASVGLTAGLSWVFQGMEVP